MNRKKIDKAIHRSEARSTYIEIAKLHKLQGELAYYKKERRQALASKDRYLVELYDQDINRVEKELGLI